LEAQRLTSNIPGGIIFVLGKLGCVLKLHIKVGVLPIILETVVVALLVGIVFITE
jgi:hypothetical protein